MSSDIFDAHNWGEVGIDMYKLVEVKGATKHPAKRRTEPTTKNYLPKMSTVMRMRNPGKRTSHPWFT